jgi:hypothetical protein
MTLTPHTPVPATGSAALAVGTGPALPIAGGGYVQLDDREAFERALSDDLDIVALLEAVRRKHTLDLTGPMVLAFERAEGTAEALRMELRQCYRWLTGGKQL